MSDQLVERFGRLIGEAFEVEDGATRWPALGVVRPPEGQSVPVAIWLGAVGRSHRERDDIERRFQNPGQNRPIIVPPGRVPLLIGIWDEDALIDVPGPVLVSADAVLREGRATRFSIFVQVKALQAATATGWHEAENLAGERLTCFTPELFPAFAVAAGLGVHLPADEAQVAAITIRASSTESLDERRRRATTTLVRSAHFKREVLGAYAGRCAMCGLGLGLVEGAHIFPVAAEGSEDCVENGLALCRNHHGALDQHAVWIDPETREIRLHPDVLASRADGDANARFIDSTLPHLREPMLPHMRPESAMFRKRYGHYHGRYEWAARRNP